MVKINRDDVINAIEDIANKTFKYLFIILFALWIVAIGGLIVFVLISLALGMPTIALSVLAIILCFAILIVAKAIEFARVREFQEGKDNNEL